MYFDTCEDILRESIAGDVIPSAAFAIGQGREVLRSGVMGDRTRFPEPEKADRDTLYDLVYAGGTGGGTGRARRRDGIPPHDAYLRHHAAYSALEQDGNA